MNNLQLDITDVSPEAVHELSKEALYQNYRYNRINFPYITVEQLKVVFPNAKELEAEFKAERN